MGCKGQSTEGITTIVSVMMENRSYDHYLGGRTLVGLPGDGLVATMSNPDLDGNAVPVLPIGSNLCTPDPPHSWAASHAQFNNGANNGFLSEYERRHGRGANGSMSYMTRNELPITWSIADAYTTCDRWFASVMGPTWPNRMFWHSAQSRGVKENRIPDGGINWPTIHHQLDNAGVPWAYYYNDLPFVPTFKELDVEGRVKRFLYDFIDDAAAGALPPVVFIDPAFTLNDDHPPHHPLLGQQFISLIYNTLAASPQWNNLLLLVTYDEHGGFHDHVAPPKTSDDRAAEGFDQLGFRVPTMVAGPYVKQSYVSSVQFDHTSVLAHIATMFDLPPLTARSSAASDLTDCIDLDRLQARTPAPPTPIVAMEIDEDELAAACSTAGRSSIPRGSTNQIPQGWDRSHRYRDIPYQIGECLDLLDAGRICRRPRRRPHTAL